MKKTTFRGMYGRDEIDELKDYLSEKVSAEVINNVLHMKLKQAIEYVVSHLDICESKKELLNKRVSHGQKYDGTLEYFKKIIESEDVLNNEET